MDKVTGFFGTNKLALNIARTINHSGTISLTDLKKRLRAAPLLLNESLVQLKRLQLVKEENGEFTLTKEGEQKIRSLLAL